MVGSASSSEELYLRDGPRAPREGGLEAGASSSSELVVRWD